jgi:hypothetical protein
MEAVVEYFKAAFQDLPGGITGNHKIPQSG